METFTFMVSKLFETFMNLHGYQWSSILLKLRHIAESSSHCRVGFLECFSLNIPIFSFLSVFFNWASLFPLQMEIWVLFFVGMINSQIPYNVRYKLGYLFSSLTIYCTKWTLYVMAIVVRWVDSTSGS